MNYKHYIITRFNISTRYDCRLNDPDNPPMLKILDEDYLEERFNLFEKYTLPSIKNQTNQNFKWIIQFHKRTPKKFLNRIKELKKIYNFEDVYLKSGRRFNFQEYCEKNNENYDYYITTRIDNDDMIDEDYIKEIQDYVNNNNLHECFISFVHGMKLDLNTNKKYDYFHEMNHFISMIKSTNEKTALNIIHSKLREHGLDIVRFKTEKPMWVEIIHNSNVTNRITEKDILNKISDEKISQPFPKDNPAINNLIALKNKLNEQKKSYLTEYITVGDYTYGKPKVKKYAGNMKLKIGKFCSIANDVIFLLGGEHRADWISTYPFNFLVKDFSYIKGHPKIKGDINVGNDVWIGHGVKILSGVNIGDGAVIGANTLVTKDVPNYAIVAGNPAQIIHYRFDEDTIKKLEKIKWWNFKEDKLVKIIPLLQNNDINGLLSTIDSFNGKMLESNENSEAVTSNATNNFHRNKYELENKVNEIEKQQEKISKNNTKLDNNIDELKKNHEKILDSYNNLFNILFIDYDLKPKGILKNTHELCQELLNFVSNVCMKYNIDYWLDYGNLLGAVRHGGFIPWDDDMDIGMMRKDYEKFLYVIDKELKENNLDKNIEVRIYKNDKVLFVQMMYTTPEVGGIFAGLDIFPYDFIESYDENTEEKFREEKVKFKRLIKNGGNPKDGLKEYLQNFNVKYAPTDYIVGGVEGVRSPFSKYKFAILDTDKIFPLAEITFNGVNYKCPKDTDYYLKAIYGDYRTIHKVIDQHTRLANLKKKKGVEEIFEFHINKLKEVNNSFMI